MINATAVARTLELAVAWNEDTLEPVDVDCECDGVDVTMCLMTSEFWVHVDCVSEEACGASGCTYGTGICLSIPSNYVSVEGS